MSLHVKREVVRAGEGARTETANKILLEMVLMMVAVMVMMIMMMMLVGSWRGNKSKKKLLLKMTQIDHRGDCDAGSGHDAMMIGLQAFHWWDWLGYWGHQAFHLAFIWQLSRINGGPNFYDSTLARPKVSITSEAETQGDKEHSSQHLQAGQYGSLCQCPVFVKIFFSVTILFCQRPSVC